MKARLNRQSITITRRGIQIALGSLWLLDGLLQLQPRMFTSAFASSVIAAAAQGQPAFIHGPMQFFIGLFAWQPVLANAGIAVTQLGLGALILWKRSARYGLLLSVAWGLFVWYVGEGLSGLASGHALMLMGSPGAALIYVLLAIAVLPIGKTAERKTDQRPAYWLIIAWAAIWFAGAVYQVLPGQNTVASVASMISTNAQGAPHWLATVDTGAAHWLKGFGNTSAAPSSMAGMPGMGMSQPQSAASAGPSTASGFGFLLTLAVIQVLVAFAVIIPGRVRLLAVVIGGILSGLFWVVGQSLGSYYTGLATDPNTGPLLVLLGIAILGCTQQDSAVVQYFTGVKDGLASELAAFNES